MLFCNANLSARSRSNSRMDTSLISSAVFFNAASRICLVLVLEPCRVDTGFFLSLLPAHNNTAVLCSARMIVEEPDRPKHRMSSRLYEPGPNNGPVWSTVCVVNRPATPVPQETEPIRAKGVSKPTNEPGPGLCEPSMAAWAVGVGLGLARHPAAHGILDRMEGSGE